MNAKASQVTIRPGLIAVRTGSRWAAVVDHDALAIEAGRLPGSVGYRSGCWCSDQLGGWGTGRNPVQAVGACGRPVTYASLSELRKEFGEPEPVTFSVAVVSQTSRRAGGGPVIERKCGHHHRHLATAHDCKYHLTKSLPDRSTRAAWFNAEVRHSDGSPLTEAEAEALRDIEIAD